MKKLRQILWVLSILSLIGEGFIYRYLPEQIPIHWNSSWEIDGYADKIYIFALGMVPIIMLLIFIVLPICDPRKENYKKHAKAYNIIEVVIVILMIVLNWISVAASLGSNDQIIRSTAMSAIGIIFIIMGNYIPTLKSNYFVGIKNPWTLSNDLVWRKTHKAGGYVFAVVGLMMIVMAFVSNKVFSNLTFAVLMIGIVGVNIYSYIIYAKLNKK